MSQEVPETSELSAFVHIVRTGSISGAATELRLPRATVSRRLLRLEEKLAVRLLRRTTRRLRLTDAGEAFFPHASSALSAAQAAADVVRKKDERPQGLLRVSTPPLRGHFADISLDFASRYPEVELELISSQAHEDLLARNIDVALRAGVEFDDGLIMRRLTSTEEIAVASPAPISNKAPACAPSRISRHHRCVVGFEKGQRPATHWPLRGGGKVRVHGVLTSNEPTLRQRAAERNLGIALLPRVICGAAVQSGRLTHVLPRRLGATSHLSLVYPERQLMKPAARAFIDLVVEFFASESLTNLISKLSADDASQSLASWRERRSLGCATQTCSGPDLRR